MENRKIKVKSLISVTAWVVALGMFIAYLNTNISITGNTTA